MQDEIKILAGRLAAHFNIDGNHHSRYLQSQELITDIFVENLILHDQILIPIQDYSAPIALIKILGEQPFIKLLEMKRIQFLRSKGFFGYARGIGPEGSIVVYDSASEVKRPFSADIDKSVEMGFISFLPTASEKTKLTSLLIDGTIEIDLLPHLDKVSKESSADLKSSSLWRSSFEFNEKGSFTFPDVPQMTVRTLGPGFKPSSIITDYYLLSTLTNLEVSLAESFGCKSISSNQASGLILRRKLERVFKEKVQTESFFKLRQLTDMPDFGKIVYQEPSKLDDLIKLVSSTDAKMFRNWFNGNLGVTDIELAKEYVALLQRVPWIKNLPTRILRFVFPTFYVDDPRVAAALGFADAFVVDHFIKGNSPKYFIDKMSKFSGVTK